MPLADTLKQVEEGRITGTPSRAGLWQAQTPQVFRRDWLEAAHAAASAIATDDAALVEALGHAVHVTAGDPLNFKITTPADLALAERWLTRVPDGAARPGGST
jgi:2-C-methyl-D-erythritol 4-phosphate cytidylyltransferase